MSTRLKSCKITISAEYEVRPYEGSHTKRKVSAEESVYLFSSETYADPVQFVEDTTTSANGLWKEYEKASKKDYSEASIHCFIETLAEGLCHEASVFRFSLYHRYGKPHVMYLRPLNGNEQTEFRGEDNCPMEGYKLTPTLYSKEYFVSTVKNAAKGWIKENIALAPKEKAE